MLNVNFMLMAGQDNMFVHVETLWYGYPASLMRVTYHAKDEKPKVFYLRVGYFDTGILSYKSKKELSKYAQDVLRKHCRGLVKYQVS